VLAAGGGGEVDTLERVGYEKRSKLGFIARLPMTLARMAVSQATMPVRARRWSERFQRRRDRFFERDLPGMSRVELREALAQLDRDFDRTGGVMLACGSNFLSSYLVTSELLRRWGGDEAAAKERHLFTGLAGLASAEPGLELLDMARFIREQPALEALIGQTPNAELETALTATAPGRVLLGRLEHFLETYGNRAAREAELSTPRWREQPQFLFEVLRSHLEAPYLPTRERVLSERRRVREETTQMIRQYFRPGLGLAFRAILAFTQENARLREALRSAVTDTLGMYRHFLLEVGRRLVLAHALAHSDDVFFLTRPEVDRYLQTGQSSDEMALTVAMRRAELVAFSEAPDPPDTFVMHGNGRIPEARLSVAPDTPFLTGLPASPGRVTGHARVIRELTAEVPLHPGEILVAPFTDVGWTPLFVIAAGVVADLGGPLSHSAVVAREYGVPAVVNVKQGTALIKTGDLITVDGDTGRVFLKP
jgi:rifampicin phosphotransferase